MSLLPSALQIVIALSIALILLESGWVDLETLRRWALWPLDGSDPQSAPLLLAGLALAGSVALAIGMLVR